MKDCLRRLGIAVDDSRPDAVRITGRGGEFAPGPIELDTGQSAVSTRLLLAMAALRPDPTTIDGHISMRNRPNKALVDALRQLGARLQSTNDGHLPTTVIGTRASARPGARAEQYLQPVPDQPADHRAAARVAASSSRWKASSPASRTSTSRSMRWRSSACASTITTIAGSRVAPQVYRAERHRRGGRRLGRVLFRGAGDVARRRASRLSNLGTRHTPGRLRVLRAVRKARRARRANACAHDHRRSARARGGFDARRRHDQHAGRRAHAHDARAIPLAPTRITGLATLRVKECDRIAAPTRELRKLGVTVEEGPDFMVIEPLGADPIARDPRSWKSRPITTTASPCRLACSDRGCRASGSSIRAASRRLIRTTGGTGSAPEAPRTLKRDDLISGRRRFGGVKSGAQQQPLGSSGASP